MKRTQLLFPVLALTLGAVLVGTAARAADIPSNNAKLLSGILSSAYFTSTQLERQLATEKGDFSPSFKLGLAQVETEMGKADRLANGHDAIAPGIRHVRDSVAAIVKDGKPTKQSRVLLDEINLELYAMVVNANILEASAHLQSAKAALGKGRGDEGKLHLQEAGKALENANNRGAYHIQNDIEEIQAALIEMGNAIDAHVAIAPERIDERIDEINSHLFDVAAEH
ncbi:MAG: hypothetical protein OEY97_12010 [Nitrospirota bacterium]|nr:hypothetical protein [Nitrospirota bacterium]